MTKKRNPNAVLREDVRKAINRMFPDGVVEMAFDSDESYFWKVYPKLAAAFRRIKGAWLIQERVPDGEPVLRKRISNQRAAKHVNKQECQGIRSVHWFLQAVARPLFQFPDSAFFARDHFKTG